MSTTSHPQDPDESASVTPLTGGIAPSREIGQRMLELMASFPTLRGVFRFWNPTSLDLWACGPVPGSGAFHTARFLLSVWNAEGDWQCGRFDLHRALAAWDEQHREAFAAWVRAPWWP